MAVSPKMVQNAVTDIVKCEFQQIAELLVKYQERCEREKQLNNYLTNNVHDDTKTFFILTKDRETYHICCLHFR